MRAIVLAILMLTALLAAPPAAAEPQLDDPAGDVVVTTTGSLPAPAAVPMSQQVDCADLRSLEIVESDDAFSVVVGVVGIASVLNTCRYEVEWTWNGRDFTLAVEVFRSQFGSGQWSYLVAREGDREDWIASFDVAVDEGANTASVDIPKVYVLDASERAPGRGDSLTGLAVASEEVIVFGGEPGLAAVDAMPDEGEGAVFTFAKGDFSQGNLILNVPERLRVSNGGATTFVYPVSLRNTGDAEDEYALTISDLPEGWNATYQSPIKVGPKQEKVVNVLASIPFAHEHGGFDAFNLSVQSARDANSQGRMRLGVLHTPIPQPAGHHSELYLHASRPADNPIDQTFSTVAPFAYGWMNTDADHASDGPSVTPNGFVNDRAYYFVGLNPSLLVGLDFDVERTATLKASLLSDIDRDLDVSANLYYYRDDGSGGESILLAEGAPVEVQASANTPAAFEVTLTPTPESDYIAYARDSYMYLEIGVPRLSPFFVGPVRTDPALLVEDFVLSLPLNEYHDRLSGAADVAQAIEMTAVGLVEKAGRPGTTLTYAFDVKNSGGDADLVIDLAGNDASAATVVPRGVERFAAGETKRVTIGMQIPLGAADGQEFEVLLFVHAQEDPSRMAIARTKTISTHTGEAAPDETGELLAAQAAQRETPGAGALVALLGLLLMALLSRRR